MEIRYSIPFDPLNQYNPLRIEFQLIQYIFFHATPNSAHYIWQWYLTNDKNEVGNPIEEERFESYATTTDKGSSDYWDY
ncbi:hypothetical protein [Oceanobacillus rekensis]|uniref:hypothetical protein n=1 Tax=Oceanobacillus rekensis TaxID=937927 RepID=UPI00111FDDF2|nr:hypothetical protein [Oceanobacillus rekensis]